MTEELDRLEKRIDELNRKCTQVLTFLSFAITAAALIWVQGHNDVMRRPLSRWVWAIFPTLIGIIPAKEACEDNENWYRIVRWSKVSALLVAIALIFWGAVDFVRAIYWASTLSSGDVSLGSNPRELEALKVALFSDNRYAGWCTLAVLVGLIFEYVFLVWLERKELTLRKIVVTLVAGTVIVAGVFGEYHFGSLVTAEAGQIENISEQRVAASNAEAKQAERRTAEIEASLADRHLTLDQRQQMFAILKGSSGTKIMVTYLLNGDKDSQEYAIEMGGVFRDAPGWTAMPPPAGVSSDHPVYGFAVQSRNRSTPSLQAVEKMLAVTGYKVTLWPAKPSLREEIDIFVGRK